MTVQENKALVRRLVEEVWNDHNIEKIVEFVGGDLIDESTEHVQQFLTAFPDVHITIEDLIGEGDKVVG